MCFIFSLLLILSYFTSNNSFTSNNINKNYRSKSFSYISENNIAFSLSIEDTEIVKKINGFYGLIGPETTNIDDIKSLYEMFIGNGFIQGVFFDNGEITYVKSFIKTEKLLNEHLRHNLFNFAIVKDTFSQSKSIFNLFLPNIFGTANTAFMLANRKVFALFERDVPYEIGIDFKFKDRI